MKTCLQIRELLTEFALGTLDPQDVRRVERHLEWCEGCRKELAELQEGLTPVALSLKAADPPPQLEEKVVARILSAAGKWRSSSRRGVRALVAATMAAILVAAGALGWAVAERRNVVDVKAKAADQLAEAKRFASVLQSVGATPYLATLRSTSSESQSSGSVIVYSGANLENFVLVQVVLSGRQESPYTFELTDRRGHVLEGGPLTKTNNGTWLFYDRPRRNLAKGVTVLILNKSGEAILSGTLTRASGK
jgi:hypothetical protein